MRTQCPCCGAQLIDDGRLSAFVDGPRHGDAYCVECGWLLVREGLQTDDWPWACPTHLGATRVPSDGPGAEHRWAAAVGSFRRVSALVRMAHHRNRVVRTEGARIRGESVATRASLRAHR